MGLVWTWIAAPGLLATLVTGALAALVWVSRPGRFQNQMLALVLSLETIVHAGGEALMYMTDVGGETAAWQIVNMCAGAALPFAYLLFLSTLDSPLVHWLRGIRARWLVGGLGVLAPIPVVVFSESVVPSLHRWSWSPWQVELGPGFLFIGILNLLVLLFGLLVAISAFRSAPPGSPTRDRARIYAWAFGIRDASFLVIGLSSPILDPLLSGLELIVLPPLVAIVYGPILAYGMLRYQLFDIDLKIKWTVKQSTVAAIFLAVIFLASEGAQIVFGDDLQWLGLLAGGALVFILAPLQRFAEHVSDKAMPHVQDTEEYRGRRAREIYLAAVESALEDGEVTDKERSVLATLADQLGLTSREALDLEREALAVA